MKLKKLFAYILTLSLILSLAGCGSKSTTVETTAENTMNEPILTQEPEEIQTPKPTSEPKQQEQTSKQTEPSANTSSNVKNETASNQQSYQNVSNFNIKGKWKNIGTYTFGQVQSGAIVAFDGKNCNVYSPQDTYAFYKDGDSYTLDCTSLLFSETISFKVKIVDKDNIHIYYGSNYLDLRRVE